MLLLLLVNRRSVEDSSKLFSILIALACYCDRLLAILVWFIYQFLQFDWSKMKNLEENAVGDQKMSAGLQLFCGQFFQYWLFFDDPAGYAHV